MAVSRQKATGYSTMIPRASNYGVNIMQGSIVGTLSLSASEEYWLFPLPPNCLVVGGVISGSIPGSGIVSGGAAVIKLGTAVTDNLFGTFTISTGAALGKTAITLGVTTLSVSDDHLPYVSDIVATVNSGTTATVSLSLYVELQYVMPGKA